MGLRSNVARAAHRDGKADWKQGLKALIKADRISAFDKAKTLYAVSKSVPHGEWLAFWNPPRKGWSVSKVEKWCSVGRLLEELNSDNYPNLPHVWSALHQVSRLHRATVLACIEDGRVSPEMTFREAKALADELLKIIPKDKFSQKLDQASRSLRNLFENGNHQERKDVLSSVAQMHAELAAQIGTDKGLTELGPSDAELEHANVIALHPTSESQRIGGAS